jgi:small conductance mechanosensitive channel
MDLSATDIATWLMAFAAGWLPSLALAALVLVIGLWIIGRIGRLLGRLLESRQVDPTLQPFLRRLVVLLLKALLLISVASMVGIATTSFVAVLGAAGLAIGLALQGSLSNFAGGVLILLFRPYKVGDWIEAQGHAGTVSAVQVFNTVLTTPDNRVIFLPNGALAGGSIINASAMAKRRVDFVFGIGYDDDIDLAKAVLRELVAADGRIDPDPAPFVAVSELADSSVNLVLRVWADAGHYWDLKFELTEAAKKAFDARGITIPYPQRDLHLHQAS